MSVRPDGTLAWVQWIALDGTTRTEFKRLVDDMIYIDHCDWDCKKPVQWRVFATPKTPESSGVYQ